MSILPAASLADSGICHIRNDPEAVVDTGRKIEKHMLPDRLGMLMRQRLLELIRAGNEEEQPRQEPA